MALCLATPTRPPSMTQLHGDGCYAASSRTQLILAAGGAHAAARALGVLVPGLALRAEVKLAGTQKLGCILGLLNRA